MLVRLKKKYILPVKWFLTKNRMQAEAGFRSKLEVIQKKEELEKEHLLLLRQRRTKEAQETKGKLELIDWLLCQKEKD